VIQYRKVLFSWIIASVLMFSISYLWHGVILNDFNRLDYPKSVYLTASIIAYLIIGFVVARIYDVQLLDKFEKKPLLRGVIGGAASGFVIYLIAFVIGISFGGRKLEYILMDVIWQIIEQGVGGLAVGYCHIIMHRLGWFFPEFEDQ
jgi:hypothetical protein